VHNEEEKMQKELVVA